MYKKTLLATASALAALSMTSVQATEYPFPTGMTVTVERDKVPTYKDGSNVVYQVVNYFTVLMPNGDTGFALKNEAGENLTVIQDGDRYFINANVPVGDVVYFGPDQENVADPVRVMLQGPIDIGHVHFAAGSAKLMPKAKQAIRLMAQEMAESNLTSAYLVGMTDRSGGIDANLSLSERRANAAAAYLQKSLTALGVAKSVITTEHMGEYLSDSKDGVVNEFDRKVTVLIYPTI